MADLIFGGLVRRYAWEGIMPQPLHPTCTTATACTIPAHITQDPRYSFRIDGKTLAKDQRPLRSHAAARLLNQATFGPTRASIAAVLGTTTSDAVVSDRTRANDRDMASASAWVEAQMRVPTTFHRVHVRMRASPRVPGSITSGNPATTCGAGSRWSRLALGGADNPACTGSGDDKTCVPNLMEVVPDAARNRYADLRLCYI